MNSRILYNSQLRWILEYSWHLRNDYRYALLTERLVSITEHIK